METVSVILVGVGGYAGIYAEAMLSEKAVDARIEAVVTTNSSKSVYYDAFVSQGIPMHADLAACLNNHKADLAVISTPIGLHFSQSMLCLLHDCNVLVEKPICANVNDAIELESAQSKYGKFVAVGFQNSYFEDMLKMKRHIMDGVYGKPIRFKTVYAPRRGMSYYKRNGWAGRIKSDDGNHILDSPINNACAHYLHLMLFMLGDALDEALMPITVEAETYRANPNIENYDVAALRCKLPRDIELLYYAAHALEEHGISPRCCFEFEKGHIVFDWDKGDKFIGTTINGQTYTYTRPESYDEAQKLWDCIQAVRDKTIPVCTVKTALPHMQVVHTIQPAAVSCVDSRNVKRYEIDGEEYFGLMGLKDIFIKGFEENKLPYEIGAMWANKPEITKIKGVN